jgi:Family of unknown function (DUF6534)
MSSFFLPTVCGIGVTIAITRVPFFFQFNKFEGVIIPWLAASILCDIIITASLVFFLSSHRSGIKNTDDIITRLIRATIQTGLMTALWAIMDLIIYRLEFNSLHLIFNFPLAKIYTNSLMSNLNARRAQAELLRHSGDSIDVTGENVYMDTWDFKTPSRSEVNFTFRGTFGLGEVSC